MVSVRSVLNQDFDQSAVAAEQNSVSSRAVDLLGSEQEANVTRPIINNNSQGFFFFF